MNNRFDLLNQLIVIDLQILANYKEGLKDNFRYDNFILNDHLKEFIKDTENNIKELQEIKKSWNATPLL